MALGSKKPIKKSSRAMNSKDIVGYKNARITLFGLSGTGKSEYAVKSEKYADKIAVFDFEDGFGAWANKFNFRKYTYSTTNFNIEHFKQDWREAVSDGFEVFVVDSFTRIHKYLKHIKKSGKEGMAGLTLADRANVNENADELLEEMLNVNAHLVLIAWAKDEFIIEGNTKLTIHKGGIIPDVGTSQSTFLSHVMINFSGDPLNGTQRLMVEKTREKLIHGDVSHLLLDDILKLLCGD